jgi:hypothetical protein
LCSAQPGSDKIYRFSFAGSADYSGNIQTVTHEYYTNPDPPAQPELVELNSSRKPSFGIGMSFELNHQERLSYAISGILLDKGYGVVFKQYKSDNSIIEHRDRNGRLYLSLPVEIAYKFIHNDRSNLYIKGGASVDLNLHATYGYKPIGSSFVVGLGKSFPANETLTIAIEPTFRYAMYTYAEGIQIVPDKLDDYKPFSVGLMVRFSQKSSKFILP